VTLDSDSLLISHDAAMQQQQRLDEEQAVRAAAYANAAVGVNASSNGTGVASQVGGGQGRAHGKADTSGSTTHAAALPNRFFGTVEVDATTATMDFSTIVNEVIQHFAAQVGVDVTVTVEIEARTKQGFEAGLQRAVKENCGVLKFRSVGFESE
jgi:hypothetical protein